MEICFSTKPVKTAYMRRDIQRRAEQRGLAVRQPAPYPDVVGMPGNDR